MRVSIVDIPRLIGEAEAGLPCLAYPIDRGYGVDVEISVGAGVILQFHLVFGVWAVFPLGMGVMDGFAHAEGERVVLES